MTVNATLSQIAQTAYPLGHDPRELDRLTLQARMFEPITRRLFEAAGIKPGMRVLDVGSGSGDVAFLVRKLVGEGGEVVGVDRSPDAVALANARAQDRGYYNVRFVQCEIMDCLPDPQFDAVVGRLVLMYTRDAAAAVRHLVSRLRSGTLIVFQEFDTRSAGAVPAAPLFDGSIALIREALRAAGVDSDLGLRLRGVFEAAGLSAPQMRHEAVVGGGPGHPVFRVFTEVLRSLLPVVERFGLASASDIDIDTLADRAEAEVLALNGVIVAPALVGAWTRKR